jgi:DNA-binding PadR family transcriptional regulator
MRGMPGFPGRLMAMVGGRGPWGFGPPGRHGRHHGPWGDGPFPGFGGRGPFGTGRRERRGNVRFAVLALLAEEPMHGYRIIQEITERSNGWWKPSAGSVYPTISQLEDEGLVEAAEGQTPKVVRLTDAGRAYAEEHAEELAAVWSDRAEGTPDAMLALREQMAETRAVLFELVQAGSEQQITSATRVLAETRRSLGEILNAEQPPEEKEGPGKGRK